MQDIKQSVKELIGEDKFTKLRVLLGLEAAAPMPEEPKKEEKMMGEGKLKDGTMVTYDELEVGYPLMVVTEQGTNPAPDGTHEMEDGTKVSTVNGLITEIIPALPVAPAPTAAPAETQAGSTPQEDMGKKLKELMDAINAKMSAIETEISKQQETNKQMFELIEKIGDLPTSEPKKENQAFTTAKDKKQEKIDSILTTLKTLKTK